MTAQVTEEELATMTPAETYVALKEGRLTTILTGASEPPPEIDHPGIIPIAQDPKE